ncbi:hypothetical protein GCM10009758_31860 [Microbacterium hatanonis]
MIDALGVPIRLDLSALGDADATAVREAWADAAAGSDASARLVLHVVPDGDRAWWMPELSRRVTAAAIEHRKGEGWMLHATALADDDGRVVAFVGESGAGKTTLAAAVGRRFGYVTDETVFIGPGRDVAPYRKPLSVRGGGIAPKTETPPSGLGLGVLPNTPLELTAIVLLDRRDDADEPTARTLTTVEAVAALTAHTSFLSHLARPLQFVAAILAETPVVRLTYREAHDLDAIDALWQTSGNRSRGTVEPVVDAADSPPAGGLRRAAVADAIALADAAQLLVLHDDVVHTLGGIAPTLWRALGAAGDGPGLVTALVAAHGHPPEGDAEQLVGAALDELGAAGLVVEVGSGWRVAADCAWQESVGGGVVVLPLRRVRTASPLVLDEVGSLIWRAVAGAPGAGVPQISRIVERELLDAPDDLTDHVAEFIASLERALLVDRV